jgi:hypothetical protein
MMLPDSRLALGMLYLGSARLRLSRWMLKGPAATPPVRTALLCSQLCSNFPVIRRSLQLDSSSESYWTNCVSIIWPKIKLRLFKVLTTRVDCPVSLAGSNIFSLPNADCPNNGKTCLLKPKVCYF